MSEKSDKQLAVEAAVAYVQSWNASPHSQAIKPEHFIEIIQETYDKIISLDK